MDDTRQLRADAALAAFSEVRALMVGFKVPGVEKAAIAFYAGLAVRLYPRADWSVPTAATDGKSIFINPDWWLSLRRGEQFGVMVHEVLHCVLSHAARAVGLDQEVANIAGDLAINHMLREANFRLPEKGCFAGEGKYADFPKGLSMDEYYRLLTPPPEPEQPQPQEGGQQGEEEQADDDSTDKDDQPSGKDEGQADPADDPPGGGEDEPGEEDSPGQGEADSPGAEADRSPGEGGDDGSGGDDMEGDSESGEDGEPADGDGGGDGDGEPDAGPGGTVGSSGGCPDEGGCGGFCQPRDATPDLMAGQETEWQVAVAQAANAAKGLGDLPGALARLVESVVSPPPDCWEVLREFVNRRAKNDFCPSRPSRRYLPHGVYLPSLWSEELGDIVVMIDCSGSIGQAELDVFAGHMQTILEHFRCTATVVYHDIPVTWVQHWSPDDGPFKLEHHGGGGTSHVPVFQWLANYLDVESVEVPCVIAFTDLDTRLPDRAPDVPVLWAAYGNPYWRKEPPFGEIVNLHF